MAKKKPEFDALARIEMLRKARRWTKAQLYEAAGIGESTLREAEKRGGQPSFSTIRKICKAFGISITEFFLVEDDAPVVLTQLQRVLIFKWGMLTDTEQEAISTMMDCLLDSRNGAFIV